MANLDLNRQALLIDREIGDRRLEAVELSNLGETWRVLGDHAQARRDLDEALRMVRANGDRVVEANTLSTLSAVALWEGDDARALALARSALDIAAAAQARDNEIIALLALGEAELALARYAAAQKAFEQARDRALAIGAKTAQRQWRIGPGGTGTEQRGDGTARAAGCA
jgi:tetratricopeptide (TPR) repeat protein